MAPTDPSRATFELLGSVTFRDTSGEGLRLTTMVVELVDATGATERVEVAIDVTVPPSGTVTHPLPDRVSLPPGREPVRLRVSGRGVDRAGVPRATDSGEAALTSADVGPPPGGEVTLVGAGDIADCNAEGAEATARLLDAIQGQVFTLGDHVYPEGTRQAFATCYERTWGRHKGRTRPTPGNHDWGEQNGTPYFDYFGAAAGPRSGYYSFNVGAWHVLSLNSNVGGGVTSPQFQWAMADLAANPSRCTMAIWHHTRFSSGPNGGSKDMQQLWWLLDNNGVDLVLSAHEHMYERFAPQDHEGVANRSGIRLINVGTGGARLAGPQTVAANSQVRGAAWGVLRLALRGDGYSWAFVPVPGASFTDSGSDVCQ